MANLIFVYFCQTINGVKLIKSKLMLCVLFVNDLSVLCQTVIIIFDDRFFTFLTLSLQPSGSILVHNSYFS